MLALRYLTTTNTIGKNQLSTHLAAYYRLGTTLYIIPSLIDKTYRKPSVGPIFISLIPPKPVPNVTADCWLALSTTKLDNPIFSWLISRFIPVLVLLTSK